MAKFVCRNPRWIMPKSCSSALACRADVDRRRASEDVDQKRVWGEEHVGFLVFRRRAAEVEVDTDTGKIKLLKYATAVDVGKAINPLGCRQQLAGAAITGIGQALFEEIAYDNGQLINPNLVDYVLPSLGDMPAVIDPITVEVPDQNGPFGAKGIGESGLIPVAPAIANAIYDACGVRIKDLPIKAEKIFLALAESQS